MTKTNSTHNRSSIWLDIKDDFELKIIRGVYKSASRVPSITELAEQYSCGESTAQKVLESLCKEDVLTKKRGVGYFLKPFCKDKLIIKHKTTLQMDLQKVVWRAKLLGLNHEELGALFNQQVDLTINPLKEN